MVRSASVFIRLKAFLTYVTMACLFLKLTQGDFFYYLCGVHLKCHKSHVELEQALHYTNVYTRTITTKYTASILWPVNIDCTSLTIVFSLGTLISCL